MTTTQVLSGAALLLLATACADSIPVEPTAVGLTAAGARASLVATTDEVSSVSPALGAVNEKLAASGSSLRVAKMELMFSAAAYNAATSTVVFANDRARDFGQAWVKGDPRRGGNSGVTYAIGGNKPVPPIALNAAGTGLVFANPTQLVAQIEEGMQAWRGRTCSSASIARVGIPTGMNPDFMDDFLLERAAEFASYGQPSDIVQGLWQPREYFWAAAKFAGLDSAQGEGIIGVTWTFAFFDDNGTPADFSDDFPTDIDNNGMQDIGLAEVHYAGWLDLTKLPRVVGYIWDNQNRAGFATDYFSIIAHESGHALGLAHFGKVFVNRKSITFLPDGTPQVSIDDVKYAPKALMNAVYVAGRSEIGGSDHSSFCHLWASN